MSIDEVKIPAKAVAWEWEGVAFGVMGVGTLEEAHAVLRRDADVEAADLDGMTLAVYAVPSAYWRRDVNLDEEPWDLDALNTLADVTDRPGRGRRKVLWWS